MDCMVALPGQLFYSTQIPACLWFLARDKSGRPPAGQTQPLRDRRGEVLFIDARKLGRMVDRTHRELTDEDIARIAATYHAWRGETVGAGFVPATMGDHKDRPHSTYTDIPGFCRSVTIEEIRQHGYVLTPGRYVGAAPSDEKDDDDEPFEEKMQRLVAQLREQQAEARRLDEAIWKNLEELGYGG